MTTQFFLNFNSIQIISFKFKFIRRLLWTCIFPDKNNRELGIKAEIWKEEKMLREGRKSEKLDNYLSEPQRSISRRNESFHRCFRWIGKPSSRSHRFSFTSLSQANTQEGKRKGAITFFLPLKIDTIVPLCLFYQPLYRESFA